MPKPDSLDEIFPTLYSLPKKNVLNEEFNNYGKITIDPYVSV